MSRRRRGRPTSKAPDLRQIVKEELGEALTKALALPPGATATPMSQDYLRQLQQRTSGGYLPPLLPRDPYNNVAFGPGEPFQPEPFDPPLPSGRPAPRRSQYPQSWNMQTSTMRSVPWTVLRDAADNVSVMRACIEICKSSITGLEWSFTIDAGRARQLAKRSSTSSHQVIADLQDRYADDMDRLHQWWAKPDRINHWNFAEWLGALLEDQLVLDAVALYPHLTMGGDLHSLELLDATTIKPLLDHRGATPQPPLAAYQQILWGFPRGEYSQSPLAEVDAEFVSAIYGTSNTLEARTDALIYKVRNRRTRSPYGFSNVEQALVDVDLYLKRRGWIDSEFSAGVTPEMIVNVDATMTPEQLRQYETVFNDELSGRTRERMRARFLPAGFDAMFPPGLDSKFSSDLDLHLIRLICASFDVLPTSLGFTPNHGMGGMGGQGHQQGEQESQLERCTKPTARWIVDLVNEVSIQYLGMPPEVTLTFHGLDEDDEQREATLLQGYVDGGLATLNEGRDQLNKPRYTFPEADQPYLKTPTGPVFLNVDVQPLMVPGNLPGQPQPVQEAPEPDDDDANARRAEQKAFMAFLRKRAKSNVWRDFTFEVHAPEVAEAANRLAAAGDVDAVKALFALDDD